MCNIYKVILDGKRCLTRLDVYEEDKGVRSGCILEEGLLYVVCVM